MTPNLLTAMSTLTETENKNNNIQITKQSKKQKTKQNKTKRNQNHKKQTNKLQNTHTKKYSKSFTTMISRPDTALTDFTSKLKGYLSHKCNVLLQKITCWTRVSRIFFPSFSFVQGGRRENCNKISKTLHCFKRERTEK